MNIANIITIMRLLITPFIVWLILSGYYTMSLLFFIFSGLSDAIDGFIAKKFNQITILGSYLDPLADKILIVSSILILGFIGIIPSWLLILIVSRDLAILGAVIISWIFDSDLKIKPIFSSKINTFLQILYIGFILLNLSTFGKFDLLTGVGIQSIKISVSFKYFASSIKFIFFLILDKIFLENSLLLSIFLFKIFILILLMSYPTTFLNFFAILIIKGSPI